MPLYPYHPLFSILLKPLVLKLTTLPLGDLWLICNNWLSKFQGHQPRSLTTLIFMSELWLHCNICLVNIYTSLIFLHLNFPECLPLKIALREYWPLPKGPEIGGILFTCRCRVKQSRDDVLFQKPSSFARNSSIFSSSDSDACQGAGTSGSRHSVHLPLSASHSRHRLSNAYGLAPQMRQRMAFTTFPYCRNALSYIYHCFAILLVIWL